MMRNILSLLINLAMAAFTAKAVLYHVFHGDEGERRPASAHTFRYFTTDSNILAALSALAVVPFNLAALTSGTLALPEWVVTLKFVGTAAVTLTFLTVMVFLGPTQGYDVMFSGNGLYMHLIGPVIAIISFCFLETGVALTFPASLFGLLPIFIYGSVYLVLVIFIGKDKGGWEDFYGFNIGGKWPVTYVIMLAAAFAICLGLRALHNIAA